MKSVFYVFAIVTVILIIAAFSNPKKEQHIDKLRQAIAQTLNEAPKDTLSSTGSMMRFGNLLGLTFGINIVDNMLQTMVEVDDYVIFSLTKIVFGNEKSTVALGVFGNVFLFPGVKDKIGDIINGKSDLKSLGKPLP